jgi:sialidase-1
VNILQFDFSTNKNANLLSSFSIEEIELIFKNEKPVKVTTEQDYRYRPATVLRKQGQDNCDTYRIPGLITTNKGTLIAVYDNRYNNSKDLQEDIDIGMSRSTDGGQTWQPMHVIMDMGEYGGRSQRLNGIGDPCVLYDTKTNTIWVAALWMSGATEKDMLWWASKPGMTPEETGQFMLVKSTDDGLTWSQPINITEQIKNPAWQLLLQGPGRGITMTDGTLVFPAQFKADLGTKSLDGGQYTCHSTIVYSKDQGKTWQIGNGAKSNTTEAQVVQLADGSLMLNMRDDRNRADKGETNGRAVATTTDMGKTWTTHKTSNSALPEPNCMASIISANLEINGKMQQVLFFSNPDSKTDRNHMTIKACLDGGLTWPKEYQVLLNSETGYGYSCMSMVDSKTIGIVFEGVKELYFQKIPVADLLGYLLK